VSESLALVQEEFDLQPIARQDRIVFLRRYSDPAELADLARSELSSVAEDVVSLIHPYYSAMGSGGEGNCQAKFTASLTDQQVRAMQGQGLPYATLPREQAQLWLGATTRVWLGATDNRMAILNGVYQHWDKCELALSEGQFWRLQYPDPLRRGSDRGISLPGPTRGVRPHGAMLGSFAVAPPGRPAAFGGMERSVRLPTGETSLTALLDRLGQAVGYEVPAPAYAKDRKLLIAGGTAKATTLADALCELYGWTIRLDGRGQARFSRPRPTPARTPAQLHEEAAAAMPPALSMLGSRRNFAPYYREQIALITAGHKPEEWARGVRVAELPAELQERAAQVFALESLGGAVGGSGPLSGNPPPGWVVSPERGVFRWPAAQPVPAAGGRLSDPMIWFRVDGPGEPSEWGFKVMPGWR
jgi:hypothetical protein